MVRVALTSALLTTAFTARADDFVTNYYTGGNCIPQLTSDLSNVTWDEYGGIENTGPNPVSIICSINKTTSSPGDPHPDKITDIDITDFYNAATYPGIECEVPVYKSAIPSSSNNVQEADGAVTSGTYDDYMDLSAGLSTQGWWGSSSGHSWYFTQLECILQPNQELYTYQVTEEGDDHGFHIYSPTTLCYAADGVSDVNNYDVLAGNGSGFMAAIGGENTFFYQCYLPGESAQFSITWSDNSASGWEWSFSYYGSSHGSPCSNNGGGTLCSYPSSCWGTVNSCIEPGSANPGSPAPAGVWPSAYFPGPSSTNMPATGYTVSGTGFSNFLDSSTYYYAYIQQVENNGDMELVSIRTTGDSYY